MSTELEMILEFGLYNGSMNVDIYANDQKIVTCHNYSEESFKINDSIDLPCTIKIVLSEKTNKDTLVKDGKIIADKYIKLTSLKLGRIPLSPKILFDICCLDDGSKDIYWGKNGTVKINFNEEDFIVWHLKQNNLFDL